MGTDILTNILSELFDKNTIIEEYVNMLDPSKVFNCEHIFKEEVGVDVSLVINIVFQYAFYLLILKFLWKAFNTYMLGTDGDEDADPMILVINFVKALVVSMGFGLLFEYLLGIVSEITQKIMATLKIPNQDIGVIITNPDGVFYSNLGLRLMLGVYTILAIVLNVKFIKNAIELVILRAGIAFSAVGIMDSDGGVFKPYMKKFFQIVLAVLIQVVCFKLSALALGKGSGLWAFALISMAMTAPAFLQEFIMVNQGNGKATQMLYSASMITNLLRKGK